MRIPLIAVLLAACLIAAGCGSKRQSTPSSTKPVDTLQQARGTLAADGLTKESLAITEHNGGVRTFIIDEPLRNEAEVRAWAAAGETVIAFYRADGAGDVVRRVEKAPKVDPGIPRVTGQITKATRSGVLELDVKGTPYSFKADNLETFDYEHFLEHKKKRQPIIVYYDEPKIPDQRTGLTFQGFDDA